MTEFQHPLERVERVTNAILSDQRIFIPIIIGLLVAILLKVW